MDDADVDRSVFDSLVESETDSKGTLLAKQIYGKYKLGDEDILNVGGSAARKIARRVRFLEAQNDKTDYKDYKKKMISLMQQEHLQNVPQELKDFCDIKYVPSAGIGRLFDPFRRSSQNNAEQQEQAKLGQDLAARVFASYDPNRNKDQGGEVSDRGGKRKDAYDEIRRDNPVAYQAYKNYMIDLLKRKHYTTVPRGLSDYCDIRQLPTSTVEEIRQQAENVVKSAKTQLRKTNFLNTGKPSPIIEESVLAATGVASALSAITLLATANRSAGGSATVARDIVSIIGLVLGGFIVIGSVRSFIKMREESN